MHLGLIPMVYWIYDTVIRLILLYEALVWWPATNKELSIENILEDYKGSQWCWSGDIQGPAEGCNSLSVGQHTRLAD